MGQETREETALEIQVTEECVFNIRRAPAARQPVVQCWQVPGWLSELAVALGVTESKRLERG